MSGPCTAPDPNGRRREGGAALIISVLMMALVGFIGLSAMETVTRDRQVAGFHSRADTSFYAAEAGVAFGVGLIRRDAQALAPGGEPALLAYDPSAGSPPEFPAIGSPMTLGATFPAPGPPRFYTDPNASDPNNPSDPPRAIRYLGRGGPCDGWIMSSSLGSVQWAQALWDIRVRGDDPGGTTVSIQAVGTSCHPYD